MHVCHRKTIARVSTCLGVAGLAGSLCSLSPSVAVNYAPDSDWILSWALALWFLAMLFVCLSPDSKADTNSTKVIEHRNASQIARCEPQPVTGSLRIYPKLAVAFICALWRLQVVVYVVLGVTYGMLRSLHNTGPDHVSHLLSPQLWCLLFAISSLLPAVLVLIFLDCLVLSIAARHNNAVSSDATTSQD